MKTDKTQKIDETAETAEEIYGEQPIDWNNPIYDGLYWA